MTASKNPRAHLEHILFHIDGVAETIAGRTYRDFRSIYYMERAIERAVGIISEAVKMLGDELLAKYPDTEWKDIRGIGNILRHEYERVDPEVMWDIATVHLPRLRPIIEQILDDLGA